MNKSNMGRGLVAGVALLGALAALPGEASACGGEWYPVMEVDHRPMGIAMAEKQLEQGKTLDAAATVIRVMPHIKGLKAERSTLVARAQRVLAVATARQNGALHVGAQVPDYAQGSWLGRTADARAKNLEWSITALRSVAQTKKDDPAASTDLAEALAKVDSHKAEARGILEKLAKKDLIASPEGYAVLADLRQKAGDAKGQKLALQRCAAMATSQNVCRTSADS
ncbi:MAG: hypothetical protein KC776_07090 [Myxococcales bacterium]|nr:hypothetical protein [Myxococcales bacterium]MCB9578463.1 hypothetical protein [Polyangiaceae bacterium]